MARLRLQHGPIDVVLEAWGDDDAVRLGCERVQARFPTILDELVAELPRLRAPVNYTYPLFSGPIARRMAAAVWPHRDVFVTPMAAVAGSVAEDLLEHLCVPGVRKAYVNDGGDIALFLSPGESLRAGIVNDIVRPAIDATTEIRFADPVRGVATSGWRGRSQSLGIADAVTVLAPTASQADAAATLIANAVNVDHPAIERRPAREIKEDSDLGELRVTVTVPSLPSAAIQEALRNGLKEAKRMQVQGHISAAYLALQGRSEILPMPDECGARRSHLR